MPGLLRLLGSPPPLSAAKASDPLGRALELPEDVSDTDKVVAGIVVPHLTANGNVPHPQALEAAGGQRAPHPDLRRFEPGDGLVLNVCVGVDGSKLAATRELAEEGMKEHQRLERERLAREKAAQGSDGQEAGPSVHSSVSKEVHASAQDSGGSSDDLSNVAGAASARPLFRNMDEEGANNDGQRGSGAGTGAGTGADAAGGSGSGSGTAGSRSLQARGCSDAGPGPGSSREVARARGTRRTSGRLAVHDAAADAAAAAGAAAGKVPFKRLRTGWSCDMDGSVLLTYLANHGLGDTGEGRSQWAVGVTQSHLAVSRAQCLPYCCRPLIILPSFAPHPQRCVCALPSCWRLPSWCTRTWLTWKECARPRGPRAAAGKEEAGAGPESGSRGGRAGSATTIGR